jgi:hypothetical protein
MDNMLLVGADKPHYVATIMVENQITLSAFAIPLSSPFFHFFCGRRMKNGVGTSCLRFHAKFFQKAKLFRLRKKSTFGENQTNRRLILSKVSWVYILRRELLQGRRYRPTRRKINPLVRKQ